MNRALRTQLALHAAAVAAATALPVLLAGLPLLARRALEPRTLGFIVLGCALAGAALGTVVLWRAVARPVDRLLAAAARLGAADGLPVLGEGGGAPLSRAAVAFERTALALDEERRRLAAKVEELTAKDRALGDAAASLARSERLATVGRLAAGLAHEVGNPLGAVTGYAELARARLPAGADPVLADAVARIAEAAGRIDRTIRGLLDFARPSPPRLEPVSLAAVVEGTLALARVQERFRRVAAEVALPADLPPVRADAHQLTQVLLNVLLNAGDAMGGEGAVALAARADGGLVELAVRDRGPGIAPEHLPRVFDPFFTTKDPGGGSGLGLAISLRIMESLGGSLAAANAEGGGAIFRIRVPVAVAVEPPGPPGRAW